MATLPTLTIPDADVPRLRAALRSRVNDPGSTMTDAQLYKAFVIAALTDVVRNYEQSQAVATAAAAVPPPPTLT